MRRSLGIFSPIMVGNSSLDESGRCDILPGMAEPRLSQTPQFNTAEYLGTSGTDQCKLCDQTITGAYYRVNGAMACASCAERAQREAPKATHAQFVRAILFGVAAAIGGIVVYAAFGIITGWMIGYISLAVGYMVGKAMVKGSKGFGGRRYQIAAVLLTYAAVVRKELLEFMIELRRAVALGETSIGISQYIKQEKAHKQAQQTASKDGQSGTAQPVQPTTAGGVLKALGTLLLIGMAFPFMELADPVHGLIGLVILFVGLQIAWKLTAGSGKVTIDGPFGRSTLSAPT